jgi:hypothetical protein
MSELSNNLGRYRELRLVESDSLWIEFEAQFRCRILGCAFSRVVRGDAAIERKPRQILAVRLTRGFRTQQALFGVAPAIA